MKRKLLVVKKNGFTEIVEREIPPLRNGEILVENHTSLISPGTEIGWIKQLRQNGGDFDLPREFGYSGAGVIVDIGKGVKRLKIGTRVATMGAGYAIHSNYTVIPQNLAIELPNSVSFEEAVYTCLGATALQGLRRAGLKLGEYGMVFGMGIVGNLTAQLSLLNGAYVMGIDTIEPRLKIAERVGITKTLNLAKDNLINRAKQFSPFGVEFAFFAFGGDATKTFENLKMCMQQSEDGHVIGRVILIGGCNINLYGGAYSGNMDILISSRTGPGYHDPQYEFGREYPRGFIKFTTLRNMHFIISMIAEGKIRVKPLTTHILTLENAHRGIDTLIKNPEEALGIILKMKH